MLTNNQIEQFHRDGYLRGACILSDDELGVMQSEVLRVIKDIDNPNVPQPIHLSDMGKKETPIWQIVNIWQASAPFERLIYNPVIAEEVAQLTGAKELRLWHDQIQYKPAGEGGVNMWHQDAPLWSMLAPMTEVSAWVALDDVDAENGCMSMVPGSHLWGNNIQFLRSLRSFDAMPAELDGHPIEVKLRPVKRGEVHYHHSLTWHGSHANKSQRPRRAIALHFMTEETRYVASGMGVMQRFVTVGDGELLKEDCFPLVWPR